MTSGDRHRRRQFALLCAHALLFQAVTFLLRPTASYRALELGVDASLLGLLAAGFALVPLAVALPAGAVADRFGESRVMAAGSATVTLAAVLHLGWAASFPALLVAAAVLGTGHLLCAVGQQSLVAGLAAPGRLDSAFGRYTFFGSVGQALGPGLLTAFGAGRPLPDTGRAFAAATALSFLLLATSVLMRRSPRDRRARPAEQWSLREMLRLPGLPRALLVSSVVLASMDIILVYLPALGAEAGLSAGTVGLLLAGRSAATMLSRLFVGPLTRRLGRRRLLVAAVGGAGLATALLPLPLPPVAVFGAAVATGFGLGVCQPATLSWLAEIAPPGVRGRTVSLRLVGNRLGQVALPSGIGLAAAGLGAAGVLWVTAAALLGAAAASRSVPLDAAGEAGS